MKHVTAFLCRGAILSILVSVFAASSWAQFVQTDGADLFAERNGIGTDCTAQANPCDLQAAITAATATADTVWVRVREVESNTRIDDDITTGATGFTIATYEEDDGPVKGVVTLEGDVTIGAAITVGEGTMLVLESDDVTIGDAGEVDGDLTLGGAGMLTLNLPGGEACVDASGINALIPGQSPTFNRLTIDGDVEVDTPGCPAASGFTAEVTVDHSLVVKSGSTLDMGGVRLKLLPTLEMDGDEEIRGSARIDGTIEGREALILMVEAESTMPAALKDTILVHDTEDLPWTRACVTVGAYFPTGCTGSPVTLPATPASNDIGQIIRIIAATDDTPGRLTILPFVLTDGYPNTPAGCFNVAGSGSINLDIRKNGDPTDQANALSQGGACVGVPEVGDGGTTINDSGALFFTGTTRLDGSIRTVGRARTEFWKLEELTEEVELFGEDAVAPLNVSGFVGNSMLPEANSVLVPTCDGSGHSSRASGIYFYSPVLIAGGLFLDNTDGVNRMRTVQGFEVTLPGTRCQEGIHFMGDGDPSKANDPSDVEVTPTRSTTVLGPIEARGRSYIRLDDWNFYHNLVLEDDIDAEFGDTFVMTTPARVRSATDTHAGVKIPANVCGYTDSRTARGNKVVLTGSLSQDIRFPADTTLAIDAIEISKSSSNGRVTVRGKALRVWNLEMTSGELVTNGTLDMSIMPSVYPTRVSHLALHTEGSLDKGTADYAYAARAARPWHLQYTGAGDTRAGDELYGPYESGDETLIFTVGWLDIFKPDGDKVTLTEDVGVANFLDLHSGILEVADDQELSIGRSTFVEYGSGSLGEGAVFFIPGDPRTYNPLLHGMNLRYYGAEDRTTGKLWFRSTSVPGIASTASVAVNGGQHCEKASPTIQLRPGVHRFETALSVTQGALDIAGNHLVAYATRLNRGQRITIGDSGSLCDSAAGMSCSAAAGASSREGLEERPLATLASAADGVKPDAYLEKTLPTFPDRAGTLTVAISADDEGMRMPVEDEQPEFRRPEGAPPVATGSALVDAIDEGVRMLRKTGTAIATRALGERLGQLRSARTPAAKSSRVDGFVLIAGNGDTEIRVATMAKTRALPSLVVARDLKHAVTAFNRNGSVTISGSGIGPQLGNNAKPNLDGVSLLSLGVEHGRVHLNSNLDVLDVAGDLLQLGGSVSLHANASDLSPRPDDEPWGVIPQHIRVSTGGIGGSHWQIAGTLEANGGEVTDFGDFVLGSDTGAVALFDLGGGTHTVTGDFAVGFDLEKADGTGLVGRTQYAHGGGCAADRVADAEDAGTTIVMGDYAFAGSGDCYEDEQFTTGQQGLSGTVVFMGDSTQAVLHRQDPDAFFGSVTVQSTSLDGAGGIVLETPVTQNAHGALTLKRGIVDTVNELYDWSMHNATSETDLAGRNTATEGGVMYGSRDSYVNGSITRAVSEGLAGGGVVTGGYLFPVGAANTDTTAARQVDHFRPLTLQFPNDLGAAGAATVNYIQQLTPALVEWPEEGLVVDGHGGGTLTLDALGGQFWLVMFDNIPAQDPNIRVTAQGLPNVLDAKGLRLIQWDCDPANLLMPPSNPRLAGVYDLEQGPVDDKSFAVNDRINGILNLTQEGMAVGQCNIIGIAANFLQNPINMPPVRGGFAKVQYIQNVADTAVDLYMDGNRVGNDWGFQTATQFANVVGGEHTLDVVAAGDADNSNPLASVTHSFVHEGNYNVILHGNAEMASVKVVEDVRTKAISENSAEFYVVHGAPELGPVDIRLLNPVDNTEVLQLVANNIDWDDVGAYISLAPGGYNFEVTTANNDRQIDVFRLELREFHQQTFVLNLSGSGTSSMEGVSMLGVENDGSTFFPSVITATEPEEELPTEFALKGNYPNPFNPSTNIQIDLPEDAEVTVQIIDMLGRRVMTIPAQELKAGARRTLEVNASSLASGTYLYRVIASSASGRNIEAGRMVLVR